MNESEDIVLMNPDRIRRSCKRMAYEIAEANPDNRPVMLFGIDQRGHATALLLKNLLDPLFNDEVEVYPLSVKTDGSEGIPDFSGRQEKAFTIVVDDVIFSGQTMFQALKKITVNGGPSEIHTAVMIDRGHRKFPILAEFVGMTLPTKLNEHVSVVVEGKKLQKVILSNPAQR